MPVKTLSDAGLRSLVTVRADAYEGRLRNFRENPLMLMGRL